jgi:hypothetical protein
MGCQTKKDAQPLWNPLRESMSTITTSFRNKDATAASGAGYKKKLFKRNFQLLPIVLFLKRLSIFIFF